MSAEQESGGWWARLRSGMRRSAASLGDNLNAVLTRRKLDAAAIEELEELLLAADLGVAAAGRIAGRIAETRFDPGAPPEQAREALADEIAGILAPVERPIDWDAAKPFVLLVVGVNGSGKTTTIGKIAHRLRTQGKSVVLAAGDTFRAAAIDQLKVWGERAGASVVAREPGADAAGLAFDAVAAAERDGADIVLIDTAGRLQNKADLMAELGKVVRVLKKRDADAPHGVLLVLDATTGQNARAQVAAFQELAGVTALAMTKLDGTAHGGMLVALAAEFALPVAYIGVGEAVADLQPFDAKAFSRALVGLGL